MKHGENLAPGWGFLVKIACLSEVFVKAFEQIFRHLQSLPCSLTYPEWLEEVVGRKRNDRRCLSRHFDRDYDFGEGWQESRPEASLRTALVSCMNDE